MTPRIVAAAGLAAGAAGIGILKAAGVAMPAVPPGMVMLLVAAVLIATVRRRWTAVTCAVAAVLELAGFVASGSASALLGTASIDTASIGIVAGNWVRLAGVVVALVAAVVAVRARAGRTAVA